MDKKRVKKGKDTASSFKVSDVLTRPPLDDYRSLKDSNKSPNVEVRQNIENENLPEEDSNDSEDSNEYSEEEDYTSGVHLADGVTYTGESSPRVRNRKRSKSPTSPGFIPKQEEDQQSKSSFDVKLLAVIGVILIAIAALAYIAYLYISHFQDFSPTPLDVETIMSGLSREFEEQPSMSVRIIRTALKRVSIPKPSAPAIILLLAAKGAEGMSHKIARKLVSAVSEKHLNISGAEYRKQDSQTGKKRIDDLINALSDDHFNAVLVENIDLMPGNTAVMFHTYCDHENAPFKRTIYVMTVASGQSISKDSNPKDWDQTVQHRLKSAWSDTGEDQLAPLLVRLTVSVAAITKNY